MDGEKKKNIAYLMLISGRNQKEDLLKFLNEMSANVVNISYGEGSVKHNSPLIEIFGFVPEKHKVIITCLLSHDKANEVIKMLEKVFDFHKVNTGIAFTVGVDFLSF